MFSKRPESNNRRRIKMNNLEANTSSRSSQVCAALLKNFITNKTYTLVHGNKVKPISKAIRPNSEILEVRLHRNHAKFENSLERDLISLK